MMEAVENRVTIKELYKELDETMAKELLDSLVYPWEEDIIR